MLKIYNTQTLFSKHVVMRVIVDSAIPFISGVLEPYAEVVYIDGKDINSHAARHSDALVVRTRTCCNRQLLEGSQVKFIATATIGRDHIDEAYCKDAGIRVCSAPGCNARGVLQWMAAALHHIVTTDNLSPKDYTLGVVGVGNVGSLVVEYARMWGFQILQCDPPRQKREGGDFIPIEELVTKADIITLHIPLDSSTYHIINEDVISTIKPNAIIINASRGAVVDNRAIARSGHRYIFDVWEGEPNIHHEILEGAMLASPHIAGYSLQGKANATAMVVQALAEHFDLPLKDWYPKEVTPTTPRRICWHELSATIASRCDLVAESQGLKSEPSQFESIRNNYDYRNEYF